MQLLQKMKGTLFEGLVQVYDPYIEKDIVPNQHHMIEEFLESVDMVIIMVGHKEIKESKELLKKKVVLDTRNILDQSEWYRL